MRVKVIYRQQRDEYVLRWKGPKGWRQKSTGLGKGEKNRRLAHRMAAKLEAELAANPPVESTEWDTFVDRFTAERLTKLSKHYEATWRSAVASLEEFCRPAELADISDSCVQEWQDSLLSNGKSESTVRSYVKHVMASLRWAEKVGMQFQEPKVELPRIGRKMRGRPITGRELVAMIRAAKRLRPAEATMWRDYLAGMWHSGLRLQESLDIGWDTTWPIHFDLNRKYPVFLIYKQKSGDEQAAPMSPNFADWLRKRFRKKGPVFELPLRRADSVGKVVTSFGKAAGVTVTRKGKYASAHDIRRAFATRWAQRLMPAELKAVMRHKDISTTLEYYVDMEPGDVVRKMHKTLGK